MPGVGVSAEILILDELVKNGTGILSPQVLSEFFTVVTRKLAAPLTSREAYTSISNYIRSWNMVDLTSLVVLEAVRGVRDRHLPYWDSHMVHSEDEPDPDRPERGLFT